jgi:hypothetical protein
MNNSNANSTLLPLLLPKLLVSDVPALVAVSPYEVTPVDCIGCLIKYWCRRICLDLLESTRTWVGGEFISTLVITIVHKQRNSNLWEMPSSGMLRSVAFVRTDASEESIASIMGVTAS